MGGGGKREGDEGITKLKTSVISAAAERKQCLLLGKAYLPACSRGWVQHCRMTLLLNVFVCVLARSRNAGSAQGKGAERSGFVVLETRSCRYLGAVLCTH